MSFGYYDVIYNAHDPPSCNCFDGILTVDTGGSVMVGVGLIRTDRES